MNRLELEPARAKAGGEDKIWGRHDWIAEEKYNGWRYLLHSCADLDRTFLTGRRISKTTGLLSEKGLNVPQLAPSRVFAKYTVLDGEIMPPSGSGFHDMASLMNADPSTAAETIKKIGAPTYRVFDVLFCDGEDVREQSLLERKKLVSRLVEEARNPLIQLVPVFSADREVYERVVDHGGEGVILKDICGAYGESGAWRKVKKFVTIDVVVTGFTDARHGRTGKYVGQIGAARVSVYSSTGDLLEVGKVSGMTDDVRRDMTDNPGRWLGTVVEIEAQEFGQERLLHPRYRRRREDAEPKHATFQKMMDDLRQRKIQELARNREQMEMPL